jgi:hypothetical protein
MTLVLAGGLMSALAVTSGLLAQAAAGQSKSPTPPATSPSSANPFPEDTRSVPVLPSKIAPELPEGTYRSPEDAGSLLPSADADPVRSPDDTLPAEMNGQEQGSSSSLKGMEKLLPQPGDDQPAKKRKLAVKTPTHQEVASKDIEVGNYYLNTKNWKAALSRFDSALVLDPENPEVYWGLAEAERHLGQFLNAKAHYLQQLEYDPSGPHNREARKALNERAIEAARQTPAPASK